MSEKLITLNKADSDSSAPLIIANKRDYFIDNVRGMATLSVIFIHTVFWSGAFYVPNYIRVISLFFDVPVFFLLTGFVFKSTGKIDSLRQSVKIICYFFTFTLVMNIITLRLDASQLIGALTFNSANIPAFPVVNGSYWFVPMYISSAIISHALINSFGRKSKIVIPLSFLYYTLSYATGIKINQEILGMSVNSLFFYVSLILIGYHYHHIIGKRRCIIICLICMILFYALFMYDNNTINLQKYKLNLSLPYVLASTISVAFVFTGVFTSHKTILSWIGQRAIFFYMSQGIGASVLYKIVHHLNIMWIPKLIVMFSINLAITLSVVITIIYMKNLLSKFS